MFEELTAQLKRHEGFRSRPYRDTAGHWTIGYGRNLDTVGIRACEREMCGGREGISRVTREQADVMLHNDIQAALSELTSRFPWVANLDAARQDAFINLAFNMGVRKLAGFKKTLAAAERGDWDESARELLASRYARQVGDRANEISEQLRTGACRDVIIAT